MPVAPPHPRPGPEPSGTDPRHPGPRTPADAARTTAQRQATDHRNPAAPEQRGFQVTNPTAAPRKRGAGPTDTAPPPGTASATAPATAPRGAPGAAPEPQAVKHTGMTGGHASADLDELARKLLEPLTRRLRAELRAGRERAGRLHDRR